MQKNSIQWYSDTNKSILTASLKPFVQEYLLTRRGNVRSRNIMVPYASDENIVTALSEVLQRHASVRNKAQEGVSQSEREMWSQDRLKAESWQDLAKQTIFEFHDLVKSLSRYLEQKK